MDSYNIRPNNYIQFYSSKCLLICQTGLIIQQAAWYVVLIFPEIIIISNQMFYVLIKKYENKIFTMINPEMNE